MSAEREVFKAIDRVLDARTKSREAFDASLKVLARHAVWEFMKEHPEVRTARISEVGSVQVQCAEYQGWAHQVEAYNPKLAKCMFVLGTVLEQMGEQVILALPRGYITQEHYDAQLKEA